MQRNMPLTLKQRQALRAQQQMGAATPAAQEQPKNGPPAHRVPKLPLTVLVCTPDATLPHAQECVAHLRRATEGLECRIVIEDNNRDPQFSHTRALNAALDRYGDGYLFICDDDALVSEDCIRAALDVVEADSEVGVVGFTLYEQRGGKQWGTAMVLDAKNNLNLHKQVYDKPVNVPASCSCAWLIAPTQIRFPEHYRKFRLEVPFCFETWLAGRRVVTVPQVVIHPRRTLGGASVTLMNAKVDLKAIMAADMETIKADWIDNGNLEALYARIQPQIPFPLPGADQKTPVKPARRRLFPPVVIHVCTPNLESVTTQRTLKSLRETTAHLEVDIVIQENGGRQPFNHAREVNRALDAFPDHIVVQCDDDISLEPGWLDAALEYAQAHPECGMIGFQQQTLPSKYWNTGMYFDAAGRQVFTPERIKEPVLMPARSSCCMVILPTELRHDESYVRYSWEHIMCYRMWETGKTVAVLPNVVYHYRDKGEKGFCDVGQSCASLWGVDDALAAWAYDTERLTQEWWDTGRIQKIQYENQGRMNIPPQPEPRPRNENVIATIACGWMKGMYYWHTLPRLRDYAARCGADFRVFGDRDLADPADNPITLKWKAAELLAEYKRVAYIDGLDVLADPETPDIFDAVPEGMLGVFDELPDMARVWGDWRKKSWPEYAAWFNETYPETPVQVELPERYFNAGVMVFDAACNPFVQPTRGIRPKDPDDLLYDQNWDNAQVLLRNIPVFWMPRTFNDMVLRDEDGPQAAPSLAHYCYPAGKRRVLPPELAAKMPVEAPRRPATRFKVALATVVAGERWEALHAVTGELQREYAERHGWDYMVIRKPMRRDDWPSPSWWKLGCGDWLRHGRYDAVVFIDADAWPWPTAKSILDVVPEGKFGAFDSFTLSYMRQRNSEAMLSWRKWCAETGNADYADAPFANGFYVNGGVWVCWKQAADVLQCWNPVDIEKYYEQHQLNLNLYAKPELFHRLDRAWNTGHNEAMLCKNGVHIAHLNGVRGDLEQAARAAIAEWRAAHAC